VRTYRSVARRGIALQRIYQEKSLRIQSTTSTNVPLHVKRGLYIQISRYGYFHSLDREMKKNYWNVSEISPTHHERAVKYFTL